MILEDNAMESIVIYVHGKGGSAAEAAHYQPLFAPCRVVGFDYAAQTPWEARAEFPKWYDAVCQNAPSVTLVANSIGAFFAMQALSNRNIEKAYLISPIVQMEKLIADMMGWANVTEEELRAKKEIPTSFGETLSWAYLCDVRAHPVRWSVPTHIVYGENDHLTSFETISHFAHQVHATLTVMQGGEHWFHTEAQMAFLDDWIRQYR